MKLVKNYARLGAKKKWYEWREKLVKSIETELLEVKDQVSKDQKYLQKWYAKLALLLEDATEYHDILKNDVDHVSETVTKRETETSISRDQLQELEKMYMGQETEILRMCQKSDELAIQVPEKERRIGALEKSKTELKASLDDIHAEVKKNQPVDCATFKQLKGALLFSYL